MNHEKRKQMIDLLRTGQQDLPHRLRRNFQALDELLADWRKRESEVVRNHEVGELLHMLRDEIYALLLLQEARFRQLLQQGAESEASGQREE